MSSHGSGPSSAGVLIGLLSILVPNPQAWPLVVVSAFLIGFGTGRDW